MVHTSKQPLRNSDWPGSAAQIRPLRPALRSGVDRNSAEPIRSPVASGPATASGQSPLICPSRAPAASRRAARAAQSRNSARPLSRLQPIGRKIVIQSHQPSGSRARSSGQSRSSSAASKAGLPGSRPNFQPAETALGLRALPRWRCACRRSRPGAALSMNGIVPKWTQHRPCLVGLKGDDGNGQSSGSRSRQFELLRPRPPAGGLSPKERWPPHPPDGGLSSARRLPLLHPAADLPPRQCSGQALEPAFEASAGIHA